MDDDTEEPKTDAHLAPEARAAEKVAELRMHSELAAVFEGPRKFEANVTAGLDPDIAREVQRAMAKFERAKIKATPVIDPESTPEAQRILTLPTTSSALTTNDYHVYRRPGEAMIVRWIAGDEVETFYERYQAHCDAALAGAREDERSTLGWRGDDSTKKYLAALDAAELNATELYFREPVKKLSICILSSTATDEMNIRFLSEHLMGATPAEVVGPASAPGEDAADRELAWYFKLFSLRGVVDGVERMCFFCFLQKSDDDFDFE